MNIDFFCKIKLFVPKTRSEYGCKICNRWFRIGYNNLKYVCCLMRVSPEVLGLLKDGSKSLFRLSLDPFLDVHTRCALIASWHFFQFFLREIKGVYLY